MSWQKMKLGELCKLNYGKGLSASNRIKGKYAVYSSAGHIDSHCKPLIESKGIIIGRKGSIGTIFYSDSPFYPIDTTYFITPENNYNLKFLYYNLKTLGLKNLNSDAAVPGLNRNQAYSQEINIPSIQTQKRIADILSSYDDLIENNLKRIKLLEQAAQNIYKEWFVNMRFPGNENTPIDQETGLPEGWENDIIEKQIAKVKRKKKLKKDDYLEKGKIPIIDQAKGLIGGYTNNLDVVQDEPLPLIVFGDHTRRVKYINFPFASGADGTQLLKPINKKMLPAYFYLAINSIDLSDYKYARHFKYLKQQFIIIPNDEILDLFNKIVEPFLNSCIQLLSFNKKLKSARDILLPRLMNQTIAV